MSIYRRNLVHPLFDNFVTSRVTIKNVHDRRIKIFSLSFIFLFSSSFFGSIRRVQSQNFLRSRQRTGGRDLL